uniref:Uncharacterized protein n=1 Tax=Glossina pallidipes TaxID=7398 RepID=A0A1A9Z7W6_GLOPL
MADPFETVFMGGGFLTCVDVVAVTVAVATSAELLLVVAAKALNAELVEVSDTLIAVKGGLESTTGAVAFAVDAIVKPLTWAHCRLRDCNREEAIVKGAVVVADELTIGTTMPRVLGPIFCCICGKGVVAVVERGANKAAPSVTRSCIVICGSGTLGASTVYCCSLRPAN